MTLTGDQVHEFTRLIKDLADAYQKQLERDQLQDDPPVRLFFYEAVLRKLRYGEWAVDLDVRLALIDYYSHKSSETLTLVVARYVG